MPRATKDFASATDNFALRQARLCLGATKDCALRPRTTLSHDYGLCLVATNDYGLIQSLRKVVLHDCGITDADMPSLTEALCPSCPWISLDLSQNLIGEGGSLGFGATFAMKPPFVAPLLTLLARDSDAPGRQAWTPSTPSTHGPTVSPEFAAHHPQQGDHLKQSHKLSVLSVQALPLFTVFAVAAVLALIALASNSFWSLQRFAFMSVHP
eukprot:s1474_g7.t1